MYSAYFTAIFLDLFLTSKVEAGASTRFFVGHARRDVSFDLVIEMKPKFLV